MNFPCPETQQIAHEDGLLELETVDGHGGHTPSRPSHGDNASCNIHLGHDPAAEDVAIGIDIGRHGHDTQGELAFRMVHARGVTSALAVEGMRPYADQDYMMREARKGAAQQ